MLRMTPLASAIVALLLGIEAYAAEETFDTHFMIGGMKDQQVANIRLVILPSNSGHAAK
ncbi:fimbrial usher domain protein [Escherichia coli 1-176-05_S4_C2]|nr:fimbrial usher domain protein [Escherichia coli 1-110-08_S4_C3]EYD99730.1 fimbrial usher domain protein [Escherichia coli 1-110-08_S4_C2]EZJ23198.1 fimbrial usher domain protein [Escherichia coli 1-176-05_S4_C3]EZJ70011.1 fimbrial usher domain protein [Escherichia coli 1-176-05_S4_C1]KDA86985.1 fimbrial usher domain protein [Escherichia coli 1-176-05_S4_C2]KDT58844.1 fimbrial usher domain protein [Escherichia coli 3-267-03_S3_C1]